jgi:hypothetical protein
MPTQFQLPRGTRVSHGTALTHLLSILDSGLVPGHSRHELRDTTEEKPKAPAVYVGGPSAFFGAWAASGALVKEYSMLERRLPLLGSIAGQSPNDLQGMDFLAPPLAIPVVLTVELQEDTALAGDEDFALFVKGVDGQEVRREEDTDESIWSRFRSGGLLREGGIPASWISSVQFPQLLRTEISTPNHMRHFGDDCFHLAAGIAQNHQMLTAHRVQVPGGFWTEKSALSQSRAFNRMAVEELLNMRHVAERANLLYNVLMLTNFVTEIGQSHFGIDFIK